MAKIYTKTGDKGETALLSGQRVLKSHERIQAYGDIDELNSLLGLSIAYINQDPRSLSEHKEMCAWLTQIQNTLFIIGSHMACDKDSFRQNLPPLPSNAITDLENAIDQCTEDLAPLKEFILPGGCLAASSLHIARSVCRRSERSIVEMNNSSVDTEIIAYVNRLSDFLFVAARYANHLEDIEDIKWTK